MKLSDTTFGIFKNFSGINQNILVRPGNVLSTVSEGKNILARANVAETFPREFAIYDLTNMINVINVWDDVDIDFQEGFFKVEKDNKRFRYNYADPSVVTSAPDKELEIEPFFTFDLSANAIAEVQKAASVLAAPTFRIHSENGAVSITVGDPSNTGANTFDEDLSLSSDSDFDCRLKVENIKILPGDYTVRLGKKKAMHFQHKSLDLQYWLAMEPSSVV